MDQKLRKTAVSGFATLVFLAPFKFTQVVVSEELTPWPQTILEWIIMPWPNSIFYTLFFLICIPALLCKPTSQSFARWTWLWPLLFVISQCVSSLQSIDASLSFPLLKYFWALSLGYIAATRVIHNEQDIAWILKAWIWGSLPICLMGIFQAQDGFEHTRKMLETHPELLQKYPEIWGRAYSTRVYSYFVSPNALGGYLASTLFVITAWFFKIMEQNTFSWKKILNSWETWISPLMLTSGLFYCSWEAQSKGSYLVFFITWIGAAFLLFRKKLLHAGLMTAGIITIAILIFLLGFGQKNDGPKIIIDKKGVIEIGKKNWNSRLGMWKAALKIGTDHPILGSGPGTFAVLYPKYKTDSDENTRLAHNNYLQIWSDSGILGLITFTGWIFYSLWLCLIKSHSHPNRIQLLFLGCACLMFALHSFVDFDLYMISNAWPIFLLLGHCVASSQKNRLKQDL